MKNFKELMKNGCTWVTSGNISDFLRECERNEIYPKCYAIFGNSYQYKL